MVWVQQKDLCFSVSVPMWSFPQAHTFSKTHTLTHVLETFCLLHRGGNVQSLI